ncbi:hypothetical protein [Zoogloea sp.]|uniref:hypothetical protein n=1 Tax=Zoogloea sp. TaxID=49181 RepID=UPI00260552B0|nr:hypothetical protein [Zoogloea sp.]
MDSPWKQEMESAGTEFFSSLSMVLPGASFMLYEFFAARALRPSLCIGTSSLFLKHFVA